MRGKLFIIVMSALSLAVVPLFTSVSTAGHEMHSHGHGDATHGHNALIEEMQILDHAFQQVVSAVSLGDGAKVSEALESMHGTMEKTHEAVHEGAVRIPKNAHRQKEFVKMDKEFHRNLERLAEAGKKNDQAKMLSLTKKLLDGCVNCHRDFRK